MHAHVYTTSARRAGYRAWLILGVLLLLALGACGSGAPAAPTQPAATAPAAGATAAPTTASAGGAPASPQPQPTATQAIDGPAPGTLTPVPTSPKVSGQVLLPADAPWVRLGQTIRATGTGQGELAVSESLYGVSASPDGTQIVFAEATTLVLLDARTGERRTLLEGTAQVVRVVFAPDSQQLALLLTDQAGWQLQILKLADGSTQTIQQGSLQQQVLSPLAWTPAGLFTQLVLWASDAPAQGIVLLDPQSGQELARYAKEHVRAFPAPDGQQVAILWGEGRAVDNPGYPAAVGVLVLDLASGREQPLLPASSPEISMLAWTPAGAAPRLAAVLRSPEDPARLELYVANADGSGEQRIALAGVATPEELRDLAWRDDSALLVLARDEQGQLRLDTWTLNGAELSVSDGEVLGPSSMQWGDQILYLPR